MADRRLVGGLGSFGDRLFDLEFRLTANRLRGATEVGFIGGSVTEIGAILTREGLGRAETWFKGRTFGRKGEGGGD